MLSINKHNACMAGITPGINQGKGVNMDNLVIDGSHFKGVLGAVEYMIRTGYCAKDVELIYLTESKVYELRLLTQANTIIATTPY
jgi:hypothetical protein